MEKINNKMNKLIIYFEYLIILIIIILFIYIILYINISTINYLKSIKDSILTEFNKLTNLYIRYEKISPFIIGNIKIFEVVIYDSKGLNFKLGNIEIYYSLFSVFVNNKNPLSIFKKIVLKNFDLKLYNKNDYENIKNIINNLKLIKKKPNQKPLKIENLSIEIPKGKIHIIDNKNQYLIESDNLKIKFEKNISISSDLNVFLIKNEDIVIKSQINTIGEINYFNNKYNSRFIVSFENINFFDDTEIKNQRFQFDTDGKNFTLKRIEDSLPVVIIIKKNENKIFADIDINNLSIKSLFKSEKKNKYFPDLLTIKSNLGINLDSVKQYSGEIILNTYYDKLLFFKKLNFDLNATLKNQYIYFNKFLLNTLNNNENYIKLEGNFPFYNANYELFATINNFLLPLTKINTKISIKKNNNQTNIVSSDLLINDINLNKFHINLIENNNDFQINTIKDLNGYSVNGLVSNKSNNFTANLQHKFNNFIISNIFKIFYKNFNKEIILNGELNSDFTKNEFKIDNAKLEIYRDDIKTSNLNLEFKKYLLYLNYLEINKKNIPLNINSSINFNKKPLTILLNIDRNKMKFDINSIISKEKINVTVNNDLSIEYNTIDGFLIFNADNFKLPNNETEFNFNFVFNLNNKSINENFIFIKKIKIFKNETGNFTSLMKLKNNVLSFNKMRYVDNSNIIEGDLVNEITYLNNNFNLKGDGSLKDELKNESYLINYDINKNNINAKLQISNMNINKIMQNNIKGFINSNIEIKGDIKNPDINIGFNTSNGKFGNNDLIAYFNFQKINQNFNLKKAVFQIDQNRLEIKNALIQTLNNKSQSININGNIFLDGLQKNFKTNFTLNGYADSLFKNNNFFNIDLLFTNLTLGFRDGFNLDKVEKYDNQKFTIMKINNIIKIINNGKNLISFENYNNNLIIKTYNENNITLDSSINLLQDKNISAKIKFIKFPVNFIQKFLLPFVGIENGLLEGTINLTGSYQRPEFNGNLNLFNGTVSLEDYLPEPIENITGIITAEKNRILVKNVNGQVRNGLAHGYGEILFNGWKLERYEFHVNSGIVPAVIKKGPVDAKGTGYIEDFIIEGRPKNFNFIGYFVVVEADIALESLLGLNKREKLKSFPINVDINFKTGNNVKIIHPIISGTVNPDEKFTLKYNGDEAKIYLGGKFKLKKGEVNYLNKKFTIEEADFQFFEDEFKINPKVNLKAYYRTRDSKRDIVKIYLTMNDRLIPFKTSFYSSPYKSQEDINGLLGFPVIYSQNTENENNVNNFTTNDNKVNISTLSDTTDYLSNSLIFTPFENRIRKITRLDTFSMETKFLGNIIKSNYEPSSNTLDLLDESSVKLGKYLSNELYFESMLSFNKRKDYSDLFFLPLNDQNYGLNLQLMLQLEIKYFSIGYTFLPKDYYNLYRSNHNISFEAEFKF